MCFWSSRSTCKGLLSNLGCESQKQQQNNLQAQTQTQGAALTQEQLAKGKCKQFTLPAPIPGGLKRGWGLHMTMQRAHLLDVHVQQAGSMTPWQVQMVLMAWHHLVFGRLSACSIR